MKLFFILSFMSIYSFDFAQAGDICASTYQELEQTENLKAVKNLIPLVGKNGFVNQTKGSYFFLESFADKIEITFLTTGLFDLYGIKRQGALKFCDRNGVLRVEGINKNLTIKLTSQGLQFGDGGPREVFDRGPIPEALRKIHNLAAEPIGVAVDREEP